MTNNETTFPMLVKGLADNILAHIEYVELHARVQRAKYEALLKEGFTQEEALQLVK